MIEVKQDIIHFFVRNNTMEDQTTLTRSPGISQNACLFCWFMVKLKHLPISSDFTPEVLGWMHFPVPRVLWYTGQTNLTSLATCCYGTRCMNTHSQLWLVVNVLSLNLQNQMVKRIMMIIVE